MDYVLTTDALCKHYGYFKALDGLNMHVPKGSIYGFVGKNGAGKTTLIRLVCGLQHPTAGRYRLYGKESESPEITSSRRRMGAVVEKPAIYGEMTAEDNLKMQYRVIGLPSEEGIHELLQLVLRCYVRKALYMCNYRGYAPCAKCLHVAKDVRSPFGERHLKKHVSRAAVEKLFKIYIGGHAVVISHLGSEPHMI